MSLMISRSSLSQVFFALTLHKSDESCGQLLLATTGQKSLVNTHGAVQRLNDRHVN